MARSHSAAVPMVIATEIANGELNGGGLTERERQRCSVRRDRGLCGFRGGGSDAVGLGGVLEWYGVECVSVCDVDLPSTSQVVS